MQRHAQHLISLFRRIVPAGAAALLIASAALPLAAQSSVPPTARQAATMPQFAAKLAHGASRIPHRAQPRASYKNPANAFAPPNRGWMPQGDIYDNGPINGTTDAWTINFGFVIADSFPTNGGQITGLSFGAWLEPGDVVQAVEVSISSQPFGGTTYFDQWVNVTQSNCFSNQYGFNVCTATGSFNGPNLSGGTYWVNLQNAQVNTGDPVYWDENSGPSMAEESSVGTIPSEAFSLLGHGSDSTCFQSQGNLHIIHDFTPQEGTGDGVVIDQAGNLYGTNPNEGDHGAGFAYKLAHLGGWIFDPLFSFFGGNSGGPPAGVILGTNGSLYGGAQGGIQNCGSDGSEYCGLVFNLKPQPTFCASALCSWNENVPYRFSSESDGSGIINVSAHDQQGNLYGTTSTGGAYGFGTVFELTRSGGNWTKTTLYSFTGGVDGATPTYVLAGNDGNLYGVADGGDRGPLVVFQLTPSGGQWTLHIVYRFKGFDQEFSDSLIQDSAGNLYGIVDRCCFVAPSIFRLQRTGSGWSFSEESVRHGGDFDGLSNLVIDAAGNLYGTGGGGDQDTGHVYGYIFKAWYANDGWHYQDLDFLDYTIFFTSGSLALDASGNLYGTTYECGANQFGTVWQFSP